MAWEGVGFYSPAIASGTPAAGDYLYTSTTAGAATYSSTRSAGAFGQVISTDGTDIGTVDLWGETDAADAASGVEELDLHLSHRFLLVGHRGDIGSSDSYPEDTLQGVIQAWVKGAPIAEVDAHLTSDSVWVVMHDTTVTRTTTSTGSISGMTAATFAALSIDDGYGYDAGRHGTSLHPPTLEAVVKAAAQYGGVIQIEPKVTLDAAFTSLATAIVGWGRERNVQINCTTSTGAAAVKAVSRAITTIAHNSIYGATADPDADWVTVTSESAAAVQAAAPKPVAGGRTIGYYGTDESDSPSRPVGLRIPHLLDQRPRRRVDPAAYARGNRRRQRPRRADRAGR